MISQENGRRCFSSNIEFDGWIENDRFIKLDRILLFFNIDDDDDDDEEEEEEEEEEGKEGEGEEGEDWLSRDRSFSGW